MTAPGVTMLDMPVIESALQRSGRLGSRPNEQDIHEFFRGEWCIDHQITTPDFNVEASAIVVDPNFPHVGLVSGRRLVDLVEERSGDMHVEFQERHRLKSGSC
jgi:hypothetical protein